MKKMFRKSKSFNTLTGFTLVELMIVVGVIGILAGIAIPSFMRSRHNSCINRAKSDLRVIAQAIDNLAFDTGRWPGGYILGEEKGDAEVKNLNSGGAGIVANNGTFPSWQGPYMKVVPQDPWGTNYFFDPDYQAGTETLSVVGSFGPNGSEMNDYDEDNIYVVLE